MLRSYFKCVNKEIHNAIYSGDKWFLHVKVLFFTYIYKTLIVSHQNRSVIELQRYFGRQMLIFRADEMVYMYSYFRFSHFHMIGYQCVFDWLDRQLLYLNIYNQTKCIHSISNNACFPITHFNLKQLFVSKINYYIEETDHDLGIILDDTR